MQESAYVVIISVLLIDDIQFMIILIPNYETFMAMIDNVKCPDGSTSHRGYFCQISDGNANGYFFSVSLFYKMLFHTHRHEEVVRQSTLGFCPSAHRWQ